MTDPIADMLTRMRNALLVRKETVLIPFSKFKMEVAQVLTRLHLIHGVEIVDVAPKDSAQKKQVGRVKAVFKNIQVALKYDKNGKSIIRSIVRASKPGCRQYVDKDWYQKHKGDFMVAIVSTSNGLMTSREAIKAGIGGEVVCVLE